MAGKSVAISVNVALISKWGYIRWAYVVIMSTYWVPKIRHLPFNT